MATTSTSVMLAKPMATPLRRTGAVRKPLGLGKSFCLPRCQATLNRDAIKPKAAAAPAAEVAHHDVPPPTFAGMSYNQEYDVLFKDHLEKGTPLKVKQLVPKPDKAAQAKEPGAYPLLTSNGIWALPRTHQWLNREWTSKDKMYGAFIGGMHALALLAPFTFSWPNFWMFMGGYFVTGALGVTLSYHRQLTHKSFKTPKWLEYVLAYCGVMSCQGDPIEWVSCHRYHHVHCDTPLDPHSPYEGFWWSHAGWLLDDKATHARVYDTSNAKDLASDPFYKHLQKHYIWHVVAQLVALYALAGWGGLIWGGALRMIWVWNITWFVNSASHVWGYQDYNTGDLSYNNWWVGLLAFGEGWHNNHHAFESSARHGLEWWQLDCTWLLICALKEAGLAWDIKLPTEAQKNRLRFKPKAA